MNLKERLRRHLECTPSTKGALFIAANATVVGDVVLGPRSSVFYGAILRGDINTIRVGEGTNLQDGVIVHLADDHGVAVGSWCTVGHGAILHACRVGDECLIGMGATVLDGSVIGRQTIVGANSLVPQGFRCPAGSLVYGSPARVIRPLTKVERRGLRRWALKYVGVARAHARLAAGYTSSVKKV